jgi:hypothetical protein
MTTIAELARSARRMRALQEIREAEKTHLALRTLKVFEDSVWDEAFAQAAGSCPRASVTTPAWMRQDLNRRALEDAERRVIEAALALDGATTGETPLDQIITEHNDACADLRRLRRQCAQGSR